MVVRGQLPGAFPALLAAAPAPPRMWVRHEVPRSGQAGGLDAPAAFDAPVQMPSLWFSGPEEVAAVSTQVRGGLSFACAAAAGQPAAACSRPAHVGTHARRASLTHSPAA